MKDNICLKYQYTIFGDFSDIAPEKSEIIIRLMKLFPNENFIPASFQELSMDQIPPRIDNRISLTNSDGLCINIGKNRVDVEINYLEDGKYCAMDINEITKKAQKLISELMGEFGKTCNRLAVNIIKLMNEEKSNIIIDKFKDTKNIFDYYESNEPFEWNERFVSKIDSEKIGEPINVITSVSKSNGILTTPKNTIQIDGIMLQFDINTLPTNVNYRFSKDIIGDFFEDAIKEEEKIEKEIDKRN
ncbi:MAG: hypothetical protein IKG42_03330 [Clostridia bacterium]|nr:hypothetical protein [Clostridia bacterium]